MCVYLLQYWGHIVKENIMYFKLANAASVQCWDIWLRPALVDLLSITMFVVCTYLRTYIPIIHDKSYEKRNISLCYFRIELDLYYSSENIDSSW